MPEIDNKETLEAVYKDLSRTSAKSGRWVRAGERIWWDRARHQILAEEVVAQGQTNLTDAGLVMVLPIGKHLLSFFGASDTLGLPVDNSARAITRRVLKNLAKGSQVTIEVEDDR